MTTHEFGERFDDDVGAVLDRTKQDRRRHRVVDHQRNAVPVRDIRQRPDIGDIPGRIADALAIDRPRVAVDHRLDVGGGVAAGEPRRDSLVGQQIGQQRVGRAIELRHGNNIPARLRQVRDCIMQCGLAGTHAHCSMARLEGGNSAFEDRIGGIADAAVAMAFDLEIEQGGPMLRIVEPVCDRLIDRNRNRARRRVLVEACMQRDCLVSHRSASPICCA